MHHCSTSFQRNSPVRCYRPTGQQQAHGSASVHGNLQLQLPPCTKQTEQRGKNVNIFTTLQQNMTRVVVPYLRARFWACANSKGTVMTASVTSEPRADWAVSVKIEMISQFTIYLQWVSEWVSATFHFVEDEFCSIFWSNILWVFSCCNLIIRFLFFVDHLNIVSISQSFSTANSL